MSFIQVKILGLYISGWLAIFQRWIKNHWSADQRLVFNMCSCTKILNARQLLDSKMAVNLFPILSPFWSQSFSSCNKQDHCRSKSTCTQEICNLTLICEYPFIGVEMVSIYYWEGRGAHKIKSMCMNKG